MKTDNEPITPAENFWIGLLFFILVNAIGYHITAGILWDEKWILYLSVWDSMQRLPLIMSVLIVNFIFIGYWIFNNDKEE